KAGRQLGRIPLLTMPAPRLLAEVLRELLYTRLYRAAAESLASENASRLASMQSAEKNIDERLGQLQSTYRQERQASITEELLDISAGFEAMKNPR
ncbi:MAG: F0F1 ATP synthase subunit gamma, partial [Planctomycetota bacterium]